MIHLQVRSVRFDRFEPVVVASLTQNLVLVLLTSDMFLNIYKFAHHSTEHW